MTELVSPLLLVSQRKRPLTHPDSWTTIGDIVDNPKNIKFKELAPEQLVAALPDVDIAVINGNYAIEGKYDGAVVPLN